MTTAPNSKNQHYVWRHYLDAWAETGTFCCFRLGDRKLFPTQPKAVASETYFYEAQHLTDADREYLEIFISSMKDERLRELNRDCLELTQRSIRNAGAFEANGPDRAGARGVGRATALG